MEKGPTGTPFGGAGLAQAINHDRRGVFIVEVSSGTSSWSSLPRWGRLGGVWTGRELGVV